jgi:SAM-dependent methyltransferase
MKRFYDDYSRRPQGGAAEFRIRRVLAHAVACEPKIVLDVGCGEGTLLELLRIAMPGAKLIGVDISSGTEEALALKGLEGRQGDASSGLPVPDGSVDLMIAGEVLEHLAETDTLLLEAKRVLKKGGTLILTTPNLAYLLNRLLLLIGIQPLFTETSSQIRLGRRFGFLGQGIRTTQGHLRLFTAQSLKEFILFHDLNLVSIEGYPYFQSGAAGIIDGLLAKIPNMGAGSIVIALKRN